jgi:hypothetical protein
MKFSLKQLRTGSNDTPSWLGGDRAYEWDYTVISTGLAEGGAVNGP